MKKQNISIVDFDLPFMRIVLLMVKIALAAIPALVIISVVFCFIGIVMYDFIQDRRSVEEKHLFSSGLQYSHTMNIEGQVDDLGDKLDELLAKTRLDKKKKELEKLVSEITRIETELNDYDTKKKQFTEGLKALESISLSEPNMSWAGTINVIRPVITVFVQNNSDRNLKKLFLEGEITPGENSIAPHKEMFEASFEIMLTSGSSDELRLVPSPECWERLKQAANTTVTLSFKLLNAVDSNDRHLIDHSLAWVESSLETWKMEMNRDRFFHLLENRDQLERDINHYKRLQLERNRIKAPLKEAEVILDSEEIKNLIIRKDVISLMENKTVREMLKDPVRAQVFLSRLSEKLENTEGNN